MSLTPLCEAAARPGIRFKLCFVPAAPPKLSMPMNSLKRHAVPSESTTFGCVATAPRAPSVRRRLVIPLAGLLQVLLPAAVLFCGSVHPVAEATSAIQKFATVATYTSNDPPTLPLLSSYTYSAQLSPAFALFWSLDSPAAPSAIRFAVSARTRGYVGLGIAEVGAMVGSGERERADQICAVGTRERKREGRGGG